MWYFGITGLLLFCRKSHNRWWESFPLISHCSACDTFKNTSALAPFELRFAVRGMQNEGCCFGSDTVYCWKNSEECAEKSMTQNSKHNRFLSAPAAEEDSSSSTLPYSHGSFSCLCVSVRWAGVARRRFSPGSQLTHEVTVVTLFAGSAALIPFVLCRSFTDASRVLVTVSDGLWPCVGASPCHRAGGECRFGSRELKA